MHKNTLLQDRFGRTVRYLRLSVTDRCDFRCTYCMAEDMTFLPRSEVLTLEELSLIAQTFIDLGVEKIRITGGEPLIRKDIIKLLADIGHSKKLRELCLTTNASHLAEFAQDLKHAGVKRINVSLDSLQEDRFTELTRFGKLDTVLKGLDTALAVGFDKIKLNTVLLKNYNLDEAATLVRFALNKGMDISFIEEMPLGEITSHARDVEFVSSDELRELLSKDFQLSPSSEDSGGPAKYWQVHGYDNRVGFISPHSHNFCDTCNRVRITASGRLLLCLGNEHSVDLREIIRNASPAERQAVLSEAIINAMEIKPEKHEFDLGEAPQVLRFMNATGG